MMASSMGWDARSCVGTTELQQKPSREAQEALEALEAQRSSAGGTRARQSRHRWPLFDLCVLF